MALSECYGMIKYLLVFVNLIFWAVGLAAVVLAGWMLTDRTFLVSLSEEEHHFNIGLYILLGAGILMLVVAFMGCCGAFKESQCMLVTFFSLLLVVIVAQIAAGAWLYTNRERLDDLVRKSFAETVKEEYGKLEFEDRTAIVDTVQHGFSCCGASGPSDWAASRYSRDHPNEHMSFSVSADSKTYKIPESCCKSKGSSGCRSGILTSLGAQISPEVFQDGCMDKLVEALKSQGIIILGVAIGVGVLEFLGLIFSLILCCAIGSSERYKA
ncbi:CD9 antigen-like [Belonocnema kinseyi]|uniref:CD9 antigen-like n=1 Tax=Belonocnema kinseyi TaxID=2817044 RepID=UPI00143DCD1C|nr:CD9 antigen-like [Belonocnema kinseyi]